jgi:hypothetical protein
MDQQRRRYSEIRVYRNQVKMQTLAGSAQSAAVGSIRITSDRELMLT